MPTFFDFLDRTTVALKERQRVSYRALKLELGCDDETLHDLKRELVEVRKLAVDVDGALLEWRGAPQRTGGVASVPVAPGEPTPASTHPRPPILDLPGAADAPSEVAPVSESAPRAAAPARRGKPGRFSRFVIGAGVLLALTGSFATWSVVSLGRPGEQAVVSSSAGVALDEGVLVMALALVAGVLGLAAGGTSLARRFVSLVVVVAGTLVMAAVANVYFGMQDSTERFEHLAGAADAVRDGVALEAVPGIGMRLAFAGGLALVLGGLGALFVRSSASVHNSLSRPQ